MSSLTSYVAAACCCEDESEFCETCSADLYYNVSHSRGWISEDFTPSSTRFIEDQVFFSQQGRKVMIDGLVCEYFDTDVSYQRFETEVEIEDPVYLGDDLFGNPIFSDGLVTTETLSYSFEERDAWREWVGIPGQGGNAGAVTDKPTDWPSGICEIGSDATYMWTHDLHLSRRAPIRQTAADFTYSARSYPTSDCEFAQVSSGGSIFPISAYGRLDLNFDLYELLAVEWWKAMDTTNYGLETRDGPRAYVPIVVQLRTTQVRTNGNTGEIEAESDITYDPVRRPVGYGLKNGKMWGVSTFPGGDINEIPVSLGRRCTWSIADDRCVCADLDGVFGAPDGGTFARWRRLGRVDMSDPDAVPFPGVGGCPIPLAHPDAPTSTSYGLCPYLRGGVDSEREEIRNHADWTDDPFNGATGFATYPEEDQCSCGSLRGMVNGLKRTASFFYGGFLGLGCQRRNSPNCVPGNYYSSYCTTNNSFFVQAQELDGFEPCRWGPPGVVVPPFP